MYCIQIEDLIANAFIESGRNSLPLEQIEAYGRAVVKALRDQDKEAKLILSRDDLESLNTNFFEKTNEGRLVIKLKDGITKEDLIKNFRGYLSLDVLCAMIEHS